MLPLHPGRLHPMPRIPIPTYKCNSTFSSHKCEGGGIRCAVPLISKNACRKGCANNGRRHQKRNPNPLPSLFCLHSEKIATQSAGFERMDLGKRTATTLLTHCITKMSSNNVCASAETETENEVFHKGKHYFSMPNSFCSVL